MNTRDIEELWLHPRMVQLAELHLERKLEGMLVRVLTKRKEEREVKLPEGTITVVEASKKYDLPRNIIDTWIWKGNVTGGDGLVNEEELLAFALNRARRGTREKVVGALKRIFKAEEGGQMSLAV